MNLLKWSRLIRFMSFDAEFLGHDNLSAYVLPKTIFSFLAEKDGCFENMGSTYVHKNKVHCEATQSFALCFHGRFRTAPFSNCYLLTYIRNLHFEREE